MRTCIVSRQQHERAEMMRFVVGPDGHVVADIRANLPGRGVWIVAKKKKVALAVAKNLFQRGFKKPVKVGAGLATEVEMLLENAALGSLGFARKASQCVTGATQVLAALNSGKVIALLHASDASNEGLKKFSRGTPRAAGKQEIQGDSDNTNISVFRSLTSDQLTLALGGTNVIHAALVKGGAARSFIQKMNGLEKYQGANPDDENDNFPADGGKDEGAS